MDDREIVRRCAEAMGEEHRVAPDWDGEPYNPLTNDAQAMALVKKMKLGIESGEEGEDYYVYSTDTTPMIRTWDTDLNRAICTAVANMQEAKGG